MRSLFPKMQNGKLSQLM